jgi:DNA mismatch endonuclease (patch repair protein)
MADHLSPERRSWNMSRIRSRDTIPELKVRSILHRSGYRYRLHVTDLPGKPDIVLPRYRTVLFVNGCFWHRHPSCRYATIPSTNTSYWRQKFARTVSRDADTHAQLRKEGWEVSVIWECETREPHSLAVALNKVPFTVRNPVHVG